MTHLERLKKQRDDLIYYRGKHTSTVMSAVVAVLAGPMTVDDYADARPCDRALEWALAYVELQILAETGKRP